MTAIPITQVQTLYSQGGTDLVALIALRDIQTGDTVDVGAIGITPDFTFVRKAIVMSFTANLAAICGVSGTVVTMPNGLPANSSTYLFIGGC
jgi:small-conductance mechanosensitive channel